MKSEFYYIVEIISFLIAIWRYPIIKSTKMKWFPLFLAFIIVFEFIAFYQSFYLGKPTYGINYFIAIVEIFYYGNLFYVSIKNTLKRKFIRIMIITGIVVFLISSFNHPKEFRYFYFSFILSGFFISCMALMFILEQFEENKKNDLKSDPIFWVAFGVALFFSGVSIVFSNYDYIKQHNLTLFGERLYHFVPRLLSVFLYTCISISLIICRK